MRIYKKHFVRITITGPTAERSKALDYCFNNDFDVTYSGAKRAGRHQLDAKTGIIPFTKIFRLTKHLKYGRFMYDISV